MTDLPAAAGEYLAIRRALGFKLRGHDRLLEEFIAFLADAGAPTITLAAALAWATRLGRAAAGAVRAAAVRRARVRRLPARLGRGG